MQHLRFLVEFVDIFPKDSEHYQLKEQAGIYPDSDWRLHYSSDCPDDADEQMLEAVDIFKMRKWRVRDSVTDEILSFIGKRRKDL